MFTAAYMGLVVPACAGEVSAKAFHISGLHTLNGYELRVTLISSSNHKYIATLRCTGDKAIEVSRLIKTGSIVILDDKKIESPVCLESIIIVDGKPIDQK